MSLNNILDDNTGNPPEAWTNLKVNSIKTREIIFSENGNFNNPFGALFNYHWGVSQLVPASVVGIGNMVIAGNTRPRLRYYEIDDVYRFRLEVVGLGAPPTAITYAAGVNSMKFNATTLYEKLIANGNILRFYISSADNPGVNLLVTISPDAVTANQIDFVITSADGANAAGGNLFLGDANQQIFF